VQKCRRSCIASACRNSRMSSVMACFTLLTSLFSKFRSRGYRYVHIRHPAPPPVLFSPPLLEIPRRR
jgi:hypothetical protein